MSESEEKNNQEFGKSSLTMVSVSILVIFLVLVGGVYWWVSKKSKGEVVFPAGINYTGNETTPAPQPQRPQYDYEKLAVAANWADFTSPKAQYIFQYPPEMMPLIFPGDVNDTVTFDVSDIPAQFNLMVLVETISNYDPKLTGKQEEFVKNYWKFFGGLKAMQDVEPYTNEKGLEGWKVNYVTQADSVGSDNYFFVIPGKNDKILHVNSIFPADGQTVFGRMLNSLDLNK